MPPCTGGRLFRGQCIISCRFLQSFSYRLAVLEKLHSKTHVFSRRWQYYGQKGGEILQTFHCKPRIFYGDGALEQLGRCQGRSVLVVTDRYFAQSGLAQAVGSRVPGASVTVFSEVTPDPSAELAARGAALCARNGHDVLIALGGGSPMDCAKGIVYVQEQRPLFIAIPTTSGTGSEVTSFSILSHNGVKHPIVDDALLPDWAILDPSLLQQLPQSLIADAGMDVLAHCLEAMASKNASPFSDGYAAMAFRWCYQNLSRSFDGDPSVRGTVHAAATMAGLAFDHAGLGISHALAHALGGRFHVAHGRLNGILLPAVLEYNGAACLGQYAELARVAGIEGGTERLLLRNLITALRRLRRRLHLPETLTAAGIAPADLDSALDALVTAALADPCCQTNPRTPTRQDLTDLLRQVR